eukprot:5443015-Prymnesium_polylepis.4
MPAAARVASERRRSRTPTCTPVVTVERGRHVCRSLELCDSSRFVCLLLLLPAEDEPLVQSHEPVRTTASQTLVATLCHIAGMRKRDSRLRRRSGARLFTLPHRHFFQPTCLSRIALEEIPNTKSIWRSRSNKTTENLFLHLHYAQKGRGLRILRVDVLRGVKTA